MGIIATIANGDLGAAIRAKVNALIGGFQHAGYLAGSWYAVSKTIVAAGSAQTSGTCRLVPFIVEQAITISDLGARVTTLSNSGNFHLGIYASDPTTKNPTGNAIGVTGTGATGLSTSATGSVTGAISGGNKSLTPGLYWFAMIPDNSTVVFASIGNTSTEVPHLMGSTTINSILNTTSLVNGKAVVGLTFSSGLPDMTSQTFADNTTTTMPHLAFKVASVP